MPETATAPAAAAATATVQVDSVVDLLAEVLSQSEDSAASPAAGKRLAELRGRILRGEIESPEQLEGMLAGQIAELDTLMTAQLNEILHAPAFQRLEASWRGLKYLVTNCDTGSNLSIRMLNASKEDLRRDLENAIEFDMSVLFQKIYEEEYGIYGGEPFGAIVADYEFSHHPEDVALLERFGSVAAAAHALLIGGASPELFGWASFDDLTAPRDLTKVFATADYVKWRSFRDSEDARYVGLTVPRMLMRDVYDPETSPVEEFCFEEDVSGAGRSKYLWGNAGYAFAVCLAQAFSKHRWFALIRGLEGGGRVTMPVAASYGTEEGDWVLKAPTEVSVPDLREKELADLGFLSLVHRKGTADAVFYSAQSCQKARAYDTEEATASARLSTQLQYLLCVSRFAHYLKVMMRDKTGKHMTAVEIERYLSTWLSEFCLANPESVGPEVQARKPLKDAQVRVREKRSKPGTYEAVIHLQPHFMLDEVNVHLRLVTELPPPASRA